MGDAESGGLNFTMLGAFEVRRGSCVVDVGPHKQRVLLATLLSRTNAVQSAERLIDAVWEDSPPRTARKNLQAYVSMLRKILGGHLSHTPYGYVVRCSTDELDMLRFEALSDEGRRALRGGDSVAALSSFGAALALWRGPFLADMSPTRFLGAEATRLVDRRLAVYEQWAQLSLAAGAARDVLDTIDEHVAAHPLLERLCELKLMTLHQCGRRTEALACYERFRHALADELGLDPDPALRATFENILRGAEPRATAVCPAAAARLPRDVGDFTGRERELGTLVNGLIGTEPTADVALITGQVGVGKTTLAVRFAHVVAAHFPAGQIFVSIRDLADIATMQDRLMRERLLVILDDAVDESSVRALLSSPRRSVILVTSRPGARGHSH